MVLAEVDLISLIIADLFIVLNLSWDYIFFNTCILNFNDDYCCILNKLLVYCSMV